VPTARTERDAHGVSELVDADFHCAARGFVKMNQFCHERIRPC